MSTTYPQTVVQKLIIVIIIFKRKKRRAFQTEGPICAKVLSQERA